jgi:DegV family protein with EDD domain
VSGPVLVVTDSAADLPPSWRDIHRILVVPLTVRVGGVDHRDGEELGPVAFWARCRASTEIPTTASPSPQAFAAAFRAAAERGAAEVVCVTLAAGLSSTHQSAALAAGDAPLPVHLVDSGSATLGQALVVMAAAAATAEGGAAAAGAARRAAGRVRVVGVVDQLDHLRRSGRLSASRALLGSALAVKPIVEVRDGAVTAVGRQRTVARALDALAELVAGYGPETLAVVHGDADPSTVERLVARLGSPPPPVHLLGPVVGSHLGPGAVGVALLAAATS